MADACIAEVDKHIVAESARLPSLNVPAIPNPHALRVTASSPVEKTDAQIDAQRSAQTGVAEGRELSPADTASQEAKIRKPLAIVALGNKKAPRVTPGRFL